MTTENKVIIDGVDVSECKNYSPLEYLPTNNGYDEHPDYCGDYIDHICVNHSNCYYKQLKRKEQECEELKKYQYTQEYIDKEIETSQENLKIKEEEARHYLEETYKYKQALEEIREIANLCFNMEDCIKCPHYEDCEIEDEEIPTQDICKLIITKVDEVLNEQK